MRKLILFCLLFVSVKAEAAPVLGYDVLGVAKYCDQYLAAPSLPAVSTVLEVFGNPMPCIVRKVMTQKTTDVQIDLVDATCHRNRVCPPGTPPLNDMKVMRDRALIVNHYAEFFKEVNWWVSPYLEHDIKNPGELQRAFDVIKAACKRCKLINSPVSGISLPNIPNEKHGTKVSAYSVSGDGASMFDGDNCKDDGNVFQHRLSGQAFVFGWWNELNLRCTGEKKFVPPALRTNKPTADQFLQSYHILMNHEPPKPPAPAACRTVRDVDGSKGEITKTNAEMYCNGTPDDGRGNKTLLIIQKKGRRGEKMQILNAAGKEVGCFSYYGEYSDRRFGRWYVGSCSKESPYQLFQELGNEWGFAKDSSGNCIRFNSIRRQGVYR